MTVPMVMLLYMFKGLSPAIAIFVVYIFVIGRIVYIKRNGTEQQLNGREIRLVRNGLSKFKGLELGQYALRGS